MMEKVIRMLKKCEPSGKFRCTTHCELHLRPPAVARYLIMEYASGGELFDYIVAHTRVPERDACRFFHQIIAGVEKVPPRVVN